MDFSSWIQPPPVTNLDGSEPFDGTNATVQDFWRFAMGDLRMNNTRGYLAEFLVAQALGLRKVRRVEWDEYDLLLDDTARKHESYEPLNVGQWQFYVASKDQLESIGKSIGLSAVESLTGGPTAWNDLRETVISASVGQHVNDQPWWV